IEGIRPAVKSLYPTPLPVIGWASSAMRYITSISCSDRLDLPAHPFWNLFPISLAPPLRGAQALSRWYRPRCSWPPPPSQITRRDPPGEPRAARVERPKLAATDRHMRQAFKFIAFCRAAVDATEHRAAELLVRDQDVAGNF